MAATWKVKITVTDLAGRQVRITGTRTDGEESRSYSLEGEWPASETKAKFLQRVGANLWASYQADASKRVKVSSLISDCEALLANGLNEKES